jgi:integral membrane sensor domain MASE1
MQVAATPMPTWRALAVSSAIGTPVVVSTYIIINNNFFLNKKFSSSQAREGCAMVYHNNFGSIFFKSRIR